MPIQLLTLLLRASPAPAAIANTPPTAIRFKPTLRHSFAGLASRASRWSSGTTLILSAPITGGGNRPNSTGKSAALSQNRPRAQQIAEWFDITQFTIPPAFSYGNVSRTLPDVRGPGLTNLDVSLVKNTTIHERLLLEIRAESFNVTNTPHLWLPNTNASSNQFGQISSTTGNPRVMQMAMKVIF